MGKLLLIAVLYFVGLSYTTQRCEAVFLDDLKEFVKWVTQFNNLFGDKGLNLTATAEVIGYTTKALGVLAPGVELVSLFTERFINNAKEDKTALELGNLNKRLDDIEQKLQRVEYKIEEEFAFASYNSQVLQPKINLRTVVRLLQTYPENATLTQFRQQCEQHQPFLVVGWMSQIVSDDHMGATLFRAFYTSSRCNRFRMHAYAYIVLADLMELGIYAELCAHVDASKPSKDVTDFYARTVQEVAQNITIELKKLDNNLLKEWPNEIEAEFRLAVKKLCGIEGGDERVLIRQCTEDVHKQISQKYPWEDFFVHIYKPESKEKEYNIGKNYTANTNAGGYYQFFDGTKISAIIAWREKAKERFVEGWLKTSADSVLNDWINIWKGCSGYSHTALTNLETYKPLNNTNPSWIFVIYNPLPKIGHIQSTHPQVHVKLVCWVPAGYYKQVIITGWN